MSAPSDGGPAFPTGNPSMGGNIGGMRLRDYFAAAALQGWCGSAPLVGGKPLTMSTEHAAEIANGCYLYADAMLAERTKKGGAK